MPVIKTSTYAPATKDESHQVYNGLDCCITLEVLRELKSLHPVNPQVYNFALALQAPALEMMQRGFLIDKISAQNAIKECEEKILFLQEVLDEFAVAVWGKPLNPRSPTQLIKFFYEAMKLPEVWTSKKGVRKLSTDREALETLELYFIARPIIRTILAIRDIGKQLSVLQTEVDYDGRMRTSYNIAGTETGRWSSSSSSTGTGTNLQNIAPKLRNIFIADPGWKLCGIDLEQAESREVGWLCGVLFDDWTYLDACYAGDLHTLVCKYAWPELKWTGDKKEDRAIADSVFYREYSYRDMAKKLGHGSNYRGLPPTMARHAKIETYIAENFQRNYFKAFQGIPKYHRWVAEQLQVSQKVTTVFGRTRHFFGRPNDDTTLREAIAYAPQSATGDRLNLALWRIWHTLGDSIRLTAQVHDAVYFQYKEEDEGWIISKALSLIETPLHHKGRTLIVPGEAKVGWNWGNYSPANLEGLIKFKGKDERKRITSLNRIL